MTPNASRARHLAKRRLSVGGMLTVSSAAAGATLIGLAAAGSTYALYSDSAAISPHTIQSGSQQLTINGTDELVVPSSTWTNLLPGDRVTLAVTVTTLGEATSRITAQTSAGNGSLHVRVVKADCSLDPVGGPSSTVAPTNLGLWGANEAATVCIEVSLSPTAQESQTLPFTLTFTATQQAS